MTANRILTTYFSGDEDDTALARGCSPDGPQALALVLKWRLSEPIWGWGMLGHLSAQACEKGHPCPRLHHRRDEAQDRHTNCSFKQVKKLASRLTSAVWRPSQGCPLGRCVARLPLVLARLARGGPPFSSADEPAVVRSVSIQLSGLT